MLRYLCFVTVILGVRSASAPFIKPCKLDDTACALASAQAAVPFVAPGIPELGVKPVDPLHLELVTSDQGGLQLTFRDNIVTGMKGCAVDALKTDFVKGKQQVTIRCTVELRGNYKLGGRLLVLPIRGEGRYHIKIRDIVIKAFTDITTADGADGKPHWHITSWRHTYHVKTNTHFHFENLFDGNKLLATPVEEFANSNWREVMQEIAPPIVKAIVERVVEAVEAVFKAVPADELYIP